MYQAASMLLSAVKSDMLAWETVGILLDIRGTAAVGSVAPTSHEPESTSMFYTVYINRR